MSLTIVWGKIVREAIVRRDIVLIHQKDLPAYPGASIPHEAMMHFPHASVPPYFQKIFILCGKFSKFPEKFLDFYLSKFLMTIFLVIDQPQISNFPPVSRKLLFPPYFQKFPPVFEKFTCFLHTFCVFRFPPYFDHDAFMHQPMHVLDAPEHTQIKKKTRMQRVSSSKIEWKKGVLRERNVKSGYLPWKLMAGEGMELISWCEERGQNQLAGVGKGTEPVLSL